MKAKPYAKQALSRVKWTLKTAYKMSNKYFLAMNRAVCEHQL